MRSGRSVDTERKEFEDTHLNIHLTPPSPSFSPSLTRHTHTPFSHTSFQPLAILDRVDTIDQSNGLCHKISSPHHDTVQPKSLLSLNFQTPSPFLPLLQTPVITRKCGVRLWGELRFHYWQPTQLYGHLSSSIWVPPILMSLKHPRFRDSKIESEQNYKCQNLLL